ncbi:hypothetical protein COCCADRAFT_105015, partial [Bipolaris zeicola 26-R-13]
GGTHAGLPAHARIAERFISTAHVLVWFAPRSSSLDPRQPSSLSTNRHLPRLTVHGLCRAIFRPTPQNYTLRARGQVFGFQQI